MIQERIPYCLGCPENLKTSLNEEEMIASIEDFIKAYIEQALDAEYFNRFRRSSERRTRNNGNDKKIEIKLMSFRENVALSRNISMIFTSEIFSIILEARNTRKT